MYFRKIIAMLAVVASVVAMKPCLALDINAGQIKSITKGVEKGWKYKREIKECSSFSMTKNEVIAFFKRAKLVPETSVHDLYWGACYVGGDLVIKGKLVRWRINVLGVGVIEWYGTKDIQYYYEGEPPGMK